MPGEKAPPAAGQGCPNSPAARTQKRELEAECDDQGDNYPAKRELLFGSTPPGSLMGTGNDDGASHLDAYNLLVGANGTAAACQFATNENYKIVSVNNTVTAEACAAECDKKQAECGSFEVKTEVGDKRCAIWRKGACIGPESDGYTHEACSPCVYTYVRGGGGDNGAADGQPPSVSSHHPWRSRMV